MMNQIIAWFTNPTHLLALYLVFQAAVENLPQPGTNPFYRFIYGFAHTMAIRFSQGQRGLAANTVPNGVTK